MLENQQFCKPKTSSLCKIDPAAQIVGKKKKKEGIITKYIINSHGKMY